MALLRLDNGESGELIQPLTSQTLTFIGSPSAATSAPTYSSTRVVVNGTALNTAISALDAGVALLNVDNLFTANNTFDTDLLYIDATNNKVLVGSVTSASTDILQVIKSVSGSSLAFRVENTSNTASSSAVIRAIVGGESAGDPILQVSITGGDTWTHGINNSTSNNPWELHKATSMVDGQYLLQCVQGGSGALNQLRVFNHNNTAGSDASVDVVVGGGSAGDATYKARISGGGDWIWGVDNDVLDTWKLQNSTALSDDYILQCEQNGSGGLNYLVVQNSFNTASSASQVYIGVGGTSAGDPSVRWVIPGGTSWIAGPDNSDSDTWKLCTGSAIGTNNIFQVESNGNVSVLNSGSTVIAEINTNGYITINRIIVGSTTDASGLLIFGTDPTTTGVFNAIYLDDYSGSTSQKRVFNLANSGYYNATALGTYRGAFRIKVGATEYRVPYYD